MLEYALINYKVHVILKHPAAIQNLMGGGGGELKSIHGKSTGDFKCCQEIPVKEFIW